MSERHASREVGIFFEIDAVQAVSKAEYMTFAKKKGCRQAGAMRGAKSQVCIGRLLGSRRIPLRTSWSMGAACTEKINRDLRLEKAAGRRAGHRPKMVQVPNWLEADCRPGPRALTRFRVVVIRVTRALVKRLYPVAHVPVSAVPRTTVFLRSSAVFADSVRREYLQRQKVHFCGGLFVTGVDSKFSCTAEAKTERSISISINGL
jgi:hypothetical protein